MCSSQDELSICLFVQAFLLWWSTLTQIWPLPQQSEVIIVNAALDATAITEREALW